MVRIAFAGPRIGDVDADIRVAQACFGDHGRRDVQRAIIMGERAQSPHRGTATWTWGSPAPLEVTERCPSIASGRLSLIRILCASTAIAVISRKQASLAFAAVSRNYWNGAERLRASHARCGGAMADDIRGSARASRGRLHGEGLAHDSRHETASTRAVILWFLTNDPIHPCNAPSATSGVARIFGSEKLQPALALKRLSRPATAGLDARAELEIPKFALRTRAHAFSRLRLHFHR